MSADTKPTWTRTFVRDGRWWIGYVDELPGANTQGRTLKEARVNLEDAIAMILQARRDLDEMPR